MDSKARRRPARATCVDDEHRALPPRDVLDDSLRRALVRVEAARPRFARALRHLALCSADLDDVIQVSITELALQWGEALARLSIGKLYRRVLRTAYHRAQDVLRSDQRRSQREAWFGSIPPEAPLDPERTFFIENERAAYVKACARLPPSLLEPVRLSLMSELTCTEIAAALGLPEGTVKTRIRRARALCRADELLVSEIRHPHRRRVWR